MTAPTFEARDERSRLLAGASGVTNMVAAATLAEDRGVSGDVDAAVGAKHADAMAAEERGEGAVTVEDDNRDGGIGEKLETLRAQEPPGEEAKFGLGEAGVEADFGEEGLLSMDVAVNVARGYTAYLYVDPLLPRDDVALAKDVGKVLLVGEGVRQGDLTSNGEREVTCWHRRTILDGAARPSTLDKTKGRSSDRPFDGSANPHDEACGRAPVHLKEGPSAKFAPKGSFAVGVGETAIPSNNKPCGFDNRGASFGRALGRGRRASRSLGPVAAGNRREGDRGRGTTRARGTGGEGREGLCVSGNRGTSQRRRVVNRTTHLHRRV